MYVGAVSFDCPYISIHASKSNDTWTFSPTLSNVWNNITDFLDHMAIKGPYTTGNIVLYYNSTPYHLTNWSVAGGTKFLEFTHVGSTSVSVITCTDTNGGWSSPTITETSFPEETVKKVTFHYDHNTQTYSCDTTYTELASWYDAGICPQISFDDFEWYWPVNFNKNSSQVVFRFDVLSHESMDFFFNVTNVYTNPYEIRVNNQDVVTV